MVVFPPARSRWPVDLVGIGVLLALAWGVATLPLATVIGVALATGGLLLALRRPWLVWPGLALALPVSSALKAGPVSLTDGLLAGAVALWFADGVRRRSLRLDPAPLPGLVAIYLALLLAATVQAVNLAEAATEVIKWAEVLLVTWLVGQTLQPEQKRWLVAALLLGGALQGLLGVYQFVFRIGPPFFLLFGRFMRAAGTFGQPNPYAGYLGLTLPAAVSLALWAWQRVGRLGAGRLDGAGPTRRVDLVWAFFYSAAAGIIGLGLLASWSRGGWLGALAGVGFVIVFRSRRALLLSLAGGVGIVVVAAIGGLNPDLVPAPIGARLADLSAYLGVGIEEVVSQPLTDENFSVIERLAHWIAALRMWERAPWLGVGPGNYAIVYPEVNLPMWEIPLGHAHNIYLNVLAETGLLGLAVYLLFWSLVVVWLWRQIRRAETGTWAQALRVGVLGIIVHLTVHNFFDNLYVQGMYLHLAFWLSATVAEPPWPARHQTVE